MVIKLSDYILEQSVSDASVTDIEIERVFAEMDVSMCLLNAYLKQAMYQEATSSMPPKTSTDVTNQMSKPTTSIVHELTPEETKRMSHTYSSNRDIFGGINGKIAGMPSVVPWLVGVYAAFNILSSIITSIYNLIRKLTKRKNADQKVDPALEMRARRYSAIVARYVEHFTVVIEPMTQHNTEPYLRNDTFEEFRKKYIQFINTSKKEHADATSPYDEFNRSGGNARTSSAVFDEPGGPSRFPGKFRFFTGNPNDIKARFEENISKDIDIHAIEKLIPLMDDTKKLTEDYINEGKKLQKELEKLLGPNSDKQASGR
jgi:hypothetical protein